MKLVCRYCMTESPYSARGYAAAQRAAATISDPPARVTTSWRCPGCDRMNRSGPAVQGELFARGAQ